MAAPAATARTRTHTPPGRERDVRDALVLRAAAQILGERAAPRGGATLPATFTGSLREVAGEVEAGRYPVR